MTVGFAFDTRACVGCMSCVAACMDVHDLGVGQHLRHVDTYEQGTWSYQDGIPVQHGVKASSVSLSCNHCDRPVCVDACPRHALEKDAVTGIVRIVAERCIGCGKCRTACPYDAPQIVARAQVPAVLSGGTVRPDGKPFPKRVAIKCDFCRDFPEGPACAAACLMRCLHAGDIDDLRARFGDNDNGAHLPDPSLTHPSVVLIEPQP